MIESIRSFFRKEWRIPYGDIILKIIHSFSLAEKVVFFAFVFIFIVSGVSLLWQANKLLMVEVPDYGGELSEGVIGSPRFVNPLLAISDTDRDLSSLVYSGLLRSNPDGTLTPDLAESYDISEDGLSYTFILKDNLYFHDNTKLTADDVIFTIEKAQDINIKSPRKVNWEGVKVEKVDDKTVVVRLKQPYSPFIQNATLGILPKHIWKLASAEEFPFSKYNINAIGSGPYKIDSITYTSGGLPSEYHFTAFKKYSLGEPYITNLSIKSYKNEKELVSAFKGGSIESLHSISPNQLSEMGVEAGYIKTFPLSRIFAVFFNQNNAPVFINKEVRGALNMATNKEEIVKVVLQNFAQTIDEPVPPSENSNNDKENFNETNIENAKSLLEKNGWKINEDGIMEKKDKKSSQKLLFSISTSDSPELKAVAEILQRQWQKIGAGVEIKIFEVGDLNQNIIRQRKYDSILFGEIVSEDMDLYPFWHSSQRTDPGLNIALYANIKADKILENIRKTSNRNNQKDLYYSFIKEIRSDVPAVFLYSPSFIYIMPKKVHNLKIGQLAVPSERFSNVYKWNIETNMVWKIFAKQK